MILISSKGSDPGSESVLKLERFVGPYYAMRDLGLGLVLASPEGGPPWTGLARDDQEDIDLVRRFKSDPEARMDLSDTLRLDQVYCEDFEAAFCIGNPGNIWSDPLLAGSLIATFLRSGKPVAICPSLPDLAHEGLEEGLLIMGDSLESYVSAVHALIGASKQTSHRARL